MHSDSLLILKKRCRNNEVHLFPGWAIFQSGSNYYGSDWTTKFQSFGLLGKYRHDFEPMRTRLILGVDLDYSPGEYFERRIQAYKTGDKYTSYVYVSNTDNNYDYDATFIGVSPYVHMEVSPIEKLRFTLGGRYDDMSYDYTNNMTANAQRPASTERSFSHLSPKAGVTYSFTKDVSVFLSYNHGFRVPSSGDLFKGRNGTASTAVNLQPIKIDSYETGIKTGFLDNKLTLDTSVYLMQKKDDIVFYRVATNLSEKRNAGKTEHKGIEVGLGIKPIKEVGLDVSYSYAKHTYEDYKVSSTLDYSGKEISLAPRQIVNTRLYYAPHILNGGRIEHDLFNIRASYKFNKSWEVYARVINVTDELYAESASKASTGAASYNPGMPKTFYAGLVYNWGR